MVVETVNMAAVWPPLARQRRGVGRISPYGCTGARRTSDVGRERERAYPRAASDSLAESNRAFTFTLGLLLSLLSLLCRTISRRAVTCEKCGLSR